MKYKQGLMRYTQNVMRVEINTEICIFAKCKNEIHSEIKKYNQKNSGIFAILQNAKRLALCKKFFWP